MKKTILILIFQITTVAVFSQSKKYSDYIKIADSLGRANNFQEAATAYNKAFQVNDWKGFTNDRYNAACNWAKANQTDSAFLQLEKITTKLSFRDTKKLKRESRLKNLHADIRWDKLVKMVTANQAKHDAIRQNPIAKKLETIFELDQAGRKDINSILKKYGLQSNELQKAWAIINKQDSLNLLEVENILNQYGWLGRGEIGEKANSTLFLVIQHANQKTQEKYLPMMQQAVAVGKAKKIDVALLEDRVAVGQGKGQIYGSQVVRDNTTGDWVVSKIEDEINVNKRRDAIGLEPLEEYLKYFGISYKLPIK
jgi:hypothetical protein